MKRIKLWWYKQLLKRAYFCLLAMRDEYDCGMGLLRHISSDFTHQEERVDRLFQKCKALSPN